MTKLTVAILSGSVTVWAFGHAQASDRPSFDQGRPDELIRELREFPPSLPATARSDGRPDPREERRRRLYEQLRELGNEAMPALARGLVDPDVHLRRNVALFLSVAASRWFDPARPKLDITPCLPALIMALRDGDPRVRGLAAQAIAGIGPDAAPAVPALITLLTDSDEGSRNSACIGLAGIGPAAKDALPALREALFDPSADVRRFARRAIETIEEPR